MDTLKTSWLHLQDLTLADLDFMVTNSVEMLLGADVRTIIVKENLCKGYHQTLIMQRTAIDWIVFEAINCKRNQMVTLLQCRDKWLSFLSQQIWE